MHQVTIKQAIAEIYHGQQENTLMDYMAWRRVNSLTDTQPVPHLAQIFARAKL